MPPSLAIARLRVREPWSDLWPSDNAKDNLNIDNLDHRSNCQEAGCWR